MKAQWRREAHSDRFQCPPRLHVGRKPDGAKHAVAQLSHAGAAPESWREERRTPSMVGKYPDRIGGKSKTTTSAPSLCPTSQSVGGVDRSRNAHGVANKDRTVCPLRLQMDLDPIQRGDQQRLGHACVVAGGGRREIATMVNKWLKFGWPRASPTCNPPGNCVRPERRRHAVAIAGP